MISEEKKKYIENILENLEVFCDDSTCEYSFQVCRGGVSYTKRRMNHAWLVLSLAYMSEYHCPICGNKKRYCCNLATGEITEMHTRPFFFTKGLDFKINYSHMGRN